MSGNKKLNQRDVNKIHRLHRQGLDGHTIAKNFNVAGCTIHYVLANRPPRFGAEHQKCDRCGNGVGPNRARTVKAKSGEYRFCPTCHAWVFGNVDKAKVQFEGIF